MDTIIMVCVVLAVYHGVGASTPAPTAVPTSTVSPTYSCCSGPQNLTCTLAEQSGGCVIGREIFVVMNGTVPTYPGLADAIVADLCHGTYAKRGLDVFVCTFETGEGTTYFELGLQWVFRENLPCAYIGCFERELCAVDAVARRKAQPNELFATAALRSVDPSNWQSCSISIISDLFLGHTNAPPPPSSCAYSQLSLPQALHCPLGLKRGCQYVETRCKDFLSSSPTQAPSTRAPTATCSPTATRSPTMVTSSPSVTQVATGTASTPGSLVIGLTSGVGAAALVASIVALILWKRRRGIKPRCALHRDRAAALGQGAAAASRFTERKLPADIDIFSTLLRLDVGEWNDTLGTFVVALETRVGLRERVVQHGRAWKANVFHFLTTSLSGIDDADLGDGVMTKSRLSALMVSVLASIDAAIFIQNSSEDTRDSKAHGGKKAGDTDLDAPLDPQLVDSLSLIQRACRFGAGTEERAVRSLHFYALLNRVRTSLFDSSEGIHRRTESLAVPQWLHLLQLCRETLRVVLYPHETELFQLDCANGSFSDTKLVRAASALLGHPNCVRIVAAAGSTSRGRRRHIEIKRGARLLAYNNIFTLLIRFVEKAQALASARRRGALARERGASAAFAEDEALSGSSISRDESSTVLRQRRPGATADTDALDDIIRQIAVIFSRDLRLGPLSAAVDALQFSLQKLDATYAMRTVLSLADAALARGRGGRAVHSPADPTDGRESTGGTNSTGSGSGGAARIRTHQRASHPLGSRDGGGSLEGGAGSPRTTGYIAVSDSYGFDRKSKSSLEERLV